MSSYQIKQACQIKFNFGKVSYLIFLFCLIIVRKYNVVYKTMFYFCLKVQALFVAYHFALLISYLYWNHLSALHNGFVSIVTHMDECVCLSLT